MLYFAMLHLQAQPNLGTRRKKKYKESVNIQCKFVFGSTLVDIRQHSMEIFEERHQLKVKHKKRD